MSLKQTKEKDVRLGKIVADAYLQLPDALKNTTLKTTGVVLSSLVKSLVSLKSGILTLAEIGNIYSSLVLFRVFLEHILKILAVFLKTSSEKSDDFAEQYLRLQIVEAFNYLDACDQAGLQISNRPKSVLDSLIPKVKSLPKKQVKKIGEPFRYRNLIDEIQKLIKLAQPNYLSKIIPTYAELSAFVHGGPTAQAKLDQMQENKIVESELEHIADLSVTMLFSVHRWLLMLAAANNPEFTEMCNRLDEAIKKEDQGYVLQ